MLVGIEQSVDNFWKTQSSCKKCKLAYNKSKPSIVAANRRGTKKHQSTTKFKLAKKVYDKKYRLLSKYNLSLEEYDALAIAQNNLCAICGCFGELVVDHCHASNKIRGLLCALCNSMLGYAKDNKKTLTNAIEYLAGNTANHGKPRI